jgi:predicted nucleic acid-binding protein
MISNPSRLTDTHASLVLDASALLNLLGTGFAREILQALSRPVFITSEAAGEVRRNPRDGQPAEVLVREVEAEGLLRVVEISGHAYEVFIDLVGAQSPDDLDDGEASCIAHAEEVRATVVIDESKGARIALARNEVAGCLHSMDLLASAAMTDKFSQADIRAAVTGALQFARMRVPRNYLEWVIDLVGWDLASQCPSIGRTAMRWHDNRKA